MIYLIGFVAFISLGFNIMLIDEMLRFKDYVYKTQKMTFEIFEELINTLESRITTSDEAHQGD